MNMPAEPQNDPTMEEILASIRKIISEDQPEGVTPKAQTVRAEALQAEILELTEEISAEQSAPGTDEHRNGSDVVDSPRNHCCPTVRVRRLKGRLRHWTKLRSSIPPSQAACWRRYSRVRCRKPYRTGLQQWVNSREPELINH